MMLSNLESEVDTAATTQFIEEISIIIAAQNLTPTMMSQDFLKFSGIIPKEWELAQQPVLNPNFAQLNFKNGLSMVAQPRSITLSESLNQKPMNPKYKPAVPSTIPNTAIAIGIMLPEGCATSASIASYSII